LRRPGDRHRALLGRRGLQPGRRHHAQLCPRAGRPGDWQDDEDQHRRRRHLHRRVHQRRDQFRPDQLRHRWQLPGYRSPPLRVQGRDHLPADRGVRHRRDDQGRDAGRRRVPPAGDPGRVLPGGRPPRRVVADAVLRQPDQGLPRRADDRHWRQPGQLPRRCLGPGGDQRRRAVVPRAPLGGPAAAAV
ncbi:MAG: hypothetical protein AVDCRST_MAG33-3094, partial [uncultured Thermomicrobiales bacterium]